MRKVIVLCVFLSFAAFINAQIKRNFDGLILGKTTRTEVLNHIRKKGFYPEDIDGGKAVLAKGDISFGGVVWDGVAYYFYNDVLSLVVYTKYSRNREAERMELDKVYYKLRNNLLKKYTNYKTPSSNASVPNNLFLKGKDATVEVKRMTKNRSYYVKLIYTDTVLKKKTLIKEYDDL